MAFDPNAFKSSIASTLTNVGTNSVVSAIAKSGASIINAFNFINDIFYGLGGNSSLAENVNRISREALMQRNKSITGLGFIAPSITPAVNLSYPIHDPGIYRIAFSFSKYDRPSPAAPTKFNTLGTIFLPIPSMLVDESRADWTPEKTGLTGSIYNSLTKSGMDIMNGSLDDARNTVMGNIKQGAMDYGYYAIGDVTGRFGDLLYQSLGAIPNPHIQAFFNGVKLRTHRFRYKFSPHNREESIKLKEIIREFKKHTLPSLVAGSGANQLAIPDIVQLEFMPKSEFLYEFKKCVLVGFDASYSPNGPAFFASREGAPVFVEISLELLEIEYFTSEDYGGQTAGDEVGVGRVGNLLTDIGKKIGDLF